MPNKANAKKALRQDARRADRNRVAGRNMEYAIKQTRKAVAEGNKDEANKMLLLSQKLLDKCVKRNLIKKGNSSRRKSRLATLVNKLK